MFWNPELTDHPLSIETERIALDDREKSERKAVCSNLWHDHRVHAGRARLFLDASSRWRLEEAASGRSRDVVECLYHHYETRIREKKEPEFDDPAINGGNEAKELSPYLLLCNILNLSRLFVPLRKGLPGKAQYEEVFLRFPEFESGYADWIEEKMTQTEEVHITLQAIFDVLAGRNRDYPWQPTWVVPWDSFERHLDAPADRWLQLLGMVPSPNSWLVCLQYQIREVPRLLRPTQIDAGTNSLHFPTPPGVPVEEGGHPMDLLHPCGVEKFPPEFVHRQIGYDIKFWEGIERSTGEKIETHEKLKKTSASRAIPVTDPSFPEFLSARRLQHWNRLVLHYTAKTDNWMLRKYL